MNRNLTTYKSSNSNACKGVLAYRFSFNGQEKDDEIYGEGNAYDLGLRIYDSRIGRMFSIDPLFLEYPWQTTYAYHRNSPISEIDYMGGGDDPTKKYKVQAGDNIGKLAKKFGTTPEEIQKLNPKIDWQSKRRHGKQNWLFEGESLNVPNKTNNEKNIEYPNSGIAKRELPVKDALNISNNIFGKGSSTSDDKLKQVMTIVGDANTLTEFFKRNNVTKVVGIASNLYTVYDNFKTETPVVATVKSVVQISASQTIFVIEIAGAIAQTEYMLSRNAYSWKQQRAYWVGVYMRSGNTDMDALERANQAEQQYLRCIKDLKRN